jgi:hypothetical protein
MKTSLFTLLILAGLTAGLAAQIPNTWTPESLKKIYGSGTSIGYAKSQIKSITFIKKEPASFHGGECFALIVTVLRGPGAKPVEAESPDIKVADKGDVITWNDGVSGYSVQQAAEGFDFTARHNGAVRVTAKWCEIPHGSKFVLTNTE